MSDGGHPRDSFNLDGMDKADHAVTDALARGRMHHAWLLSGPEGVGKASFAYRIARRLLGAAPDPGQGPLASRSDDPVSRQVSARSHPDLMVLERATDDGKTRKSIPVDEARALPGFFANSPAAAPYRVAIIDAADDLNVNAANAVLKTLEEPPPRGVVLLISHSPGRLLPTIRSRCRRLALKPLDDDTVVKLQGEHAPDTRPEERQALARLAEGSIGRALELSSAGSLELYREMVEVLATLPDLDMPRLHGFAERFAKRGEEANADWRSLNYLFDGWLKGLARQAALSAEAAPVVPLESGLRTRLLTGASLDRWLEASDKVAELFNRADAVNLDRKQTVMGSFFALQSAMR